jgi:manganese transport protein
MPQAISGDFDMPVYRTLLVPLDHSGADRPAVGHAVSIARQHGARVVLFHVEEDVTSQVYGSLASTAEVEHYRDYLQQVRSTFQSQGIRVDTMVSAARSPRQGIIEAAQELRPDLIIMGTHGHSGLMDIIFGTTISAVRHAVKVPLLVVQEEPKRKA